MMTVSPSHKPPPFGPSVIPDASLRGYLDTNADIVTKISKPVSIENIGALSAQSERPILFENIIEKPGFRLCDILVKHRETQARALGVSKDDFLRALAYRLRQPPRPLKRVKSGPVKEVIRLGDDADWSTLPVPRHKSKDKHPYVTAMNIVKDPETGFYQSSHAGTQLVGKRRGLTSFATPHTHLVIQKSRELGHSHMPIAFVFGVPPGYEIMANFSGLHMDMWGEVDMIGTILGRDIEMVPCETIDLEVPAEAEIVVEARVNLKDSFRIGDVTSPSMYHLPHFEDIPEVEVMGITMRGDHPIYRNHQTCPDTDHQTLPRLCHEAVVYNRLTEMGLDVKDVRFPTWGGALSCIIQFNYPRDGFVNDALMLTMGSPWLNTKMTVAISPDTDIDSAAEVYHAIATRVDPARDIFVVPGTRGSLYDPSATPMPDKHPWRIVGKIGIDATIKSRHDPADFERAWPVNWGSVKLADYL
jgi:UbiD family decarboxylase